MSISNLCDSRQIRVGLRASCTHDDVRRAEFRYWAKRHRAEGTLGNGHYVHAFTTHFRLPLDWYAGKRMLDIGCGPRGSLEWAHMAAQRVGLDPLAERYVELGTSRHAMTYVSAPSEQIPFPDAWFDVVSSFNSLDHVDDLDATIAEIIRVLKPGGDLLLLVDVGHEPTPCEPISLDWSDVERFAPALEPVEVRHLERSSAGIYQSLDKPVPYDHGNARKRYGLLSAHLRKRP